MADRVVIKVLRFRDSEDNHGDHPIESEALSFCVAVKAGAPTLNGTVLDPGDIVEFSSFSADQFKFTNMLVTDTGDDVLYTEVSFA